VAGLAEMGGLRSLADRDGTATVSLDKGELELDGLLDDGEIPAGQKMHLQRVGEGAYLVRAVTDDGLAELDDVFQP
jgi:hypothetical protein